MRGVRGERGDHWGGGGGGGEESITENHSGKIGGVGSGTISERLKKESGMGK